MGYLCVGTTNSNDNIVVFDRENNCEVLTDIIKARSKLSGCNIENYCEDSNSPFIYIKEYVKNDNEGCYKRILEICGTYDMMQLYLVRNDKDSHNIHPDDSKDGSVCSSFYKYSTKYEGFNNCTIFFRKTRVPYAHTSGKLLSAKDIKFRFNDVDFDNIKYTDETGAVIIYHVPLYLRHIDYSNLKSLEYSRGIRFCIEYTYDDGRTEEVDVKLEMGYDDYIEGWELDELRFENLSADRVISFEDFERWKSGEVTL